MKNKTLKAVVSAVVMFTVICMSFSAMAATYTTTTRYMTADTVKITSVANGVMKGEYVTHYVTDSEGGIVYLNQETGESDDSSITFEYTTSASNISSQMKFGGTSDTATNKGDEGYSELGFEITVIVNNTLAGLVVVPEQEEGILLSRKIDLTGIYDFSERITEVSFSGTEQSSEIENYSVGNGCIVLYTDAITSDGSLYIETDTASAEEFKIKYGTLTYSEPNVSMLGKVTATDGVEFGFVISAEEEITAEDVENAVTPESLEAGAGFDAVKFRAFGKGATGNFGVEIQGVTEYFAPGTYYVSAYAISNGEIKVNSTAGLGTRVFVIE